MTQEEFDKHFEKTQGDLLRSRERVMTAGIRAGMRAYAELINRLFVVHDTIDIECEVVEPKRMTDGA